jgi:hypothetical protein
MKVYVVIGLTGEYSDRDEWVVCGFTSEDKAKERVELATARARALFAEYKDSYWKEVDEKNEYDHAFKMDYTGTTYRYEELEVYE